MTRAQAQIVLLYGKAITHRLFLKGEYVKLRETDKALIDESGCVLDKQTFWLLRGGPEFNEGWSALEDSQK